MWDLQPQFPPIRQYLSLPLVTYERVMITLLCLIVLKLLFDKILSSKFQIRATRDIQNVHNIEYAPFYHLAIVILVLHDIDWNMFDLAIWTFVYVGASIVRQAISKVRAERETLLNGFSFDLKLIRVLQGSKLLGVIMFLVGTGLFIAFEIQFAGISMKVVNLLVYPIIMIAIEALFLFLSSVAAEKDILCYYNQNINEIQPTYKLQLLQKIAGNSFRVWHLYQLIRLFLRGLFSKMGILDYMWIFSVLNSSIRSVKQLVTSISKYRSYSKLMKRFDRIFKGSTSAPDQTCTICLAELLNCRQLSSCGHLFHYRCLFQWMQTKLECPVCRAPILLS